MLRECGRRPKLSDRVLESLRVEGVALHGRVLRDFFFTKLRQEKGGAWVRDTRDDIVAVDYFPTPTLWPYTSRQLPPYLTETKERMDCALAHLSLKRLDWKGPRKKWYADRLLREIGEKWFEFLGLLRQHNQAAASRFIERARVQPIPVSPPF